jgi:hypothetical protein
MQTPKWWFMITVNLNGEIRTMTIALGSRLSRRRLYWMQYFGFMVRRQPDVSEDHTASSKPIRTADRNLRSCRFLSTVPTLSFHRLWNSHFCLRYVSLSVTTEKTLTCGEMHCITTEHGGKANTPAVPCRNCPLVGLGPRLLQQSPSGVSRCCRGKPGV